MITPELKQKAKEKAEWYLGVFKKVVPNYKLDKVQIQDETEEHPEDGIFLMDFGDFCIEYSETVRYHAGRPCWVVQTIVYYTGSFYESPSADPVDIETFYDLDDAFRRLFTEIFKNEFKGEIDKKIEDKMFEEWEKERVE